MGNFILCTILFRLALPLLILSCVVFRPSLVSGIYLLLLLLSAFFPVPTPSTLKGCTGTFLKFLIAISAIMLLCQLIFQLLLLFLFPPYGAFLEKCGLIEKALRHAGFVKLDALDPVSVITWVAPEVIMLLTSIVLTVVCYKVGGGTTNSEEELEQGERDVTKTDEPQSKRRNFAFLVSLGKYMVLVSLCVAAVLRPSVVGGFYFLIFLCSCTWWACYKDLRRGFAILLRFCMVIVFCHIFTLYAYQFQWPQEFLPRNSTYARYFGFTPLMTVDCAEPRTFHFESAEWASYLNPLALIWLFYILAIESKQLLKPQVLFDEVANLGECTPLIRGVSPSRRYGSNKGSILQDSTGSVIVANDNPDDIPMQELGMGPLEDDEPTWFENMFSIMESILQFIIRTSYIATNIIMMAWSITYHSWLTFVLLLWASILWMVPNQRKSMLRSSPFLVIYAWFLLITAYIYSMDLTDIELPSIINNIDLSQIGFEKITHLPCNRLFAKCLYTAMFWITMRQFMKERIEARHSSALADMVAPLQISVGTATGVNKDQDKGNAVMIKVGNFVKTVLTKFWIWVVAITLFAVAITGQRMTGFRILYMALFLFFIISFQFSFRVWRRLMFGFWLTVIIYSMIILVMVYTYQFNNFPQYWQEYLKVSLEQQLDIGLEKYETKQLFVRLVTPTFFVIIAVVQVHYFHKDFMELSDPKNTTLTETTKSEANSSAQGGVVVESEEGEAEEEEDNDSIKLDLTDIGNVSAKQLNRKFQQFLQYVYRATNLFLLFLEIHLPKFILFMAMLVCVQDSCAIYLIIVVLIVLGTTIGKKLLSVSIYTSSLLVSILLLARMVYQIQYIEHDIWNTTCTFERNGTAFNVTGNGAEWLGFRKTLDGRKLPILVKWNIVYILTVTLWAIVQVRQSNHRASLGRSTKRPFFMFPKIKITNADNDLTHYIKYLFNFGFYRFGVEISLIATVGLIGFRMDMYALMYSFWLCLLFSMQRKTLAKVWNLYLFFIAIFIPIQYIMVIGLPPSICIDYPWENSDVLRRVQEWAYLIDPTRPLSPKKLICDFILLLIVARQSLVFRIEKRHENNTQEYVGGSNESIIHQAEQPNFVIPVPDYITYCRSYLDIAKRIVLLPCMWVTLAIVFLAGTNRVNLFSIGYLLGSFYFLWQGSDIYLKPIAKILKKWDLLIAYNVFVISMKVFLQLIGCVFMDDVQTHACWLVQLLGISCVRKFKLPPMHPGVDDAGECAVPREYIGLAWDGACFTFLILQRRIFNSYNFFHIVDESKASTILASRGAELIEELREQRMVEQDEEEHRILEKIKAKMDRIKATQQKITGPQYQDPNSHYIDQPPLAHSSSMTSCVSATSGTSQQTATPAGYHTPIDEEDEDQAPLTPVATSSLLQTNAPSPYSAIMTVSLEAYLEPNRISFSSPPNSELNPRPPSPDDSFPVFSPPPYDEAPPYAEAVSEQTTVVQRQSSIGPPWMAGSLTTPRQSVISYCSRSPLSHHTYSIYPKSNRPLYRRNQPKSYKSAIRSGDYYMFDDIDDEELDMLEELDHKEEDEDPLKRRNSKTRTLGELLSSTMKTDVSTVLKHKEKESILKRRVSLPQRKRTSSICGQQSQLSVPLSAPPGLRRVSLVVDRRKDKGDGPDNDEPMPGTSRDEELSDISDVPQEQSTCQKIMNYILFLIAFIEGFMLSATLHLNTYSKDYRYVIRVLTKEKKLLKETTDYNVGKRLGPSQSWEPEGTYRTLFKNSREPSFILTPSVGTYSPSDSYRFGFCSASPRRTDAFSSNSDRQPELDSDESDTKALATSPLPYSKERDSNKGPEEEITEMSSYDQPTLLRLLLAMWYIVLSHSDMLCYFVIFLNQIKNATFMSLPLPLLVFFWGTLTVPRPSKNFWVTIIAYTQTIVLIKCMFQFEIWPWNINTSISPFNAPKIIGIERKKDYATWDLFLLLVVFFHRFMLKCLGLWKTDFIPQVAVLVDGKYSLDSKGALVPVVEPKYDSPIRINGDKETKSSPSGSKKEDLQRLVDDDDDDSSKRVLQVSTSEVAPIELFPGSIHLTTSKYAESFKIFFTQLMDPTSRVAADVYSYMFLCDFFNFFVILIGYNSFGSQQGDEGVSSYLEDNRVPVLFLLMLILQFLLIIIDRAIFLRKNISAKIVFQFLQIFILHIWLFVIFPATTERSVNSVIPPQMYYMVKCFYLLLSAYQIRCGYPTRILGNFLCKGYGYLNMFSYKGFMLIPFLFELRTVMDWMWTDTSMTVFDWIKMEDIFAHIFQLKCTRHIESEYPQPRGEKKNSRIKYMMGGGLLAIIIAVIWFPLVFFSLGNTVGEPNPPYDVTIDLRIGPYEPIYQMSAQANTIFKFTENDLTVFSDRYKTNRAATGFISNYIASDIAAVKLSADSATVWSISPPDQERMLKEVASDDPLTVRLQYIVSHESNNKESPPVIREEVGITVAAQIDGKPNPVRQGLLKMLQGVEDATPIELDYVIPKFIKVTNRGTAKAISQFMEPLPDKEASSLRNITIKLFTEPRNNNTRSEPTKVWWEIKENCSDFNYLLYLKYLPYADCNYFMLYTFNDKIFPSTLNIITGGGIIGLYTTLVFVASRILRQFFSEICFKIMFDDMPCVDRVLQLCLDIYLVREAGEYALEEDLFAKLVFLYRSPETLIKWTRPIEELGDDEDPEGDGDHNQ